MLQLIFTSLLLGVGLAMDACAVSIANGLQEPKMKMFKHTMIALAFGVFQALMPLTGYFLGTAVLKFIEKFIPWISLGLLVLLGGKMIFDAVKEAKENKREENKENSEEDTKKSLTYPALLVQAIATSIDALSVGFTFAEYKISEVILASSLIAIVTFIISFVAVIIGKKVGKALGDKIGVWAQVIGGIILIGIGIEICLTGIL